MPKARKKPMRMCVGCRQMFAKESLVRVVRSPSGVISVDRTGKVNGRGVYICESLTCLELAAKSKQLDRSLRTKVPSELYRQLHEQLVGTEDEH